MQEAGLKSRRNCVPPSLFFAEFVICRFVSAEASVSRPNAIFSIFYVKNRKYLKNNLVAINGW